jgi:hypothetical protein
MQDSHTGPHSAWLGKAGGGGILHADSEHLKVEYCKSEKVPETCEPQKFSTFSERNISLLSAPNWHAKRMDFFRLGNVRILCTALTN